MLPLALVAALAVVTHGAEIGPAFAGDGVVWGERGDVRGDLRIVRREADGTQRVVFSAPTPTEPARRRAFQQVPAALSASGHWTAAVVVDGEDIPTGADDFGVTEVSAQPLGGRDGAPLTPLLPACRDMAFGVVATDGDKVAVGRSAGRCGRGRPRSGVYLVRGARPPKLIRAARGTPIIPQVALAGRWLAWGAASRTHLVDLRTDRTVATVPGVERGFAINDRGDLAFVHGGRLRLRRAGARRSRVVATGINTEQIALSRDRIAWVGRHRIRTATLRGRPLRAFERFDGYHRVVRGGIDLDGHRLAYGISASNPGGGDFVPGGPGELHVASTG